MPIQATAEPIVRWGESAIDPKSRDLPGLKMNYLLAHLPDRGRILEIGCGEGKILRTLAARRPTLELHGCDVRLPRVAALGYQFHHTPEGKIDLPDRSCDAVLIVDVLEHVADPHALLEEAQRLLRVNGRLVGFVPVEGELLSFYTLFRLLLGEDTYAVTKEHVQAFTHTELLDLLGGRFEIVDRRYAYHAIGQLLDATFFAAARLRAIRRFWWQDNVYYHPNKDRMSRPSAALNKLLQLGNRIAWSESTLLADSRIGAAGLLFEARRRC